MLRRFSYFWRIVEKLLRIIARTALLGIMILTMTDVSGRYLFNVPVEGAATIITDLLFPVVVFFSLAYLTQVDGHIRVEFIWSRLSGSTRRKVHISFAIATACFWGLVAYLAGLRAYDAAVLGQRPIGVIGIPTALSYGIVCIGSLTALIGDLASIVKREPDLSNFGLKENQ